EQGLRPRDKRAGSRVELLLADAVADPLRLVVRGVADNTRGLVALAVEAAEIVLLDHSSLAVVDKPDQRVERLGDTLVVRRPGLARDGDPQERMVRQVLDRMRCPLGVRSRSRLSE